ncbi:MAG: metallophosphoesterase [Opitutae bacterium]|nr:metallophosphoesterase [Opitutae bacterium]
MLFIPTPVSRRRMLRHVMVAGLALLLGGRLAAAAPASDPNRWVLMADIHIRANPATQAHGYNIAENLRMAVRAILSMEPRPAGLVVAGDCAYGRGEKADYRTLGELLEPLRKENVPFYLVPGNHDRRDLLREFLGETAATSPVPNKMAAMVRTPLANWFLLDSLEKTPDTPGVLDEAQCEWLARTLDANADKPALLVMHHHPGDPARPGCLKDTAKLFEIIRPRRQVKAWIFGHTHVWGVTQDAASGIHLINLPASGYVFKPENPCGWVEAVLKENGIRLEVHSVRPEHAKHGQVAELTWRAN